MNEPLWRGLTHQQVFDLVHTGPGPYVSDSAINAWSDAETSLRSIDADLAAAMTKAGDWEGAAADATRSGLTPLGAWAAEAAHAASRAAIAVQQHQEQVANVRAALPEPGPDPDTLSPFSFKGPGTAPREVQTVANAELAAQAFHVMDTYATNTGLIQHWVAPWSAPPSVTVAVAEPAAVTSPAGVAVGRSARVAPHPASTAVAAGGGRAPIPTVGGRPAGLAGIGVAGGDRQQEAAGAISSRAASAGGLGSIGRAGGAATGVPAVPLASTLGGAASAAPTVGGPTTSFPTWRDLPELAHVSDAAAPAVVGTEAVGGSPGSLDTGSFETPGIGSRGTAGSIGAPGPGDGVLRPIGDLDAPRGSPGTSGLFDARGSGWSAPQVGDAHVDSEADGIGRTAAGGGSTGWTGRGTGISGGANPSYGTVDGRNGLLDGSGRAPAAEPGGGTGARAAGAPGYMPMTGGGGGQAGQTHRRPAYLLDDSGAFADNRWFSEAVITPDDPLPSA